MGEPRPPEGWEWQQPPHKVPEAEFLRRRRKALERRRGIHGKDPLAGKRREIANGAQRVFWPLSEPCPVTAGDMFTVQGRPITIKRVKEDHHDGEKVWAASIERLPLAERPRYLRAGTLPSDPPERDELDKDGYVPPPRPGEIERAAELSAYTTSIARALDKEAEAVPRDWEDRGKEERNTLRLRAVEELRAEEEARRAEEEARAWLVGVIRQVPPAERVAFIKQLRAGAGHLLEEYLDEAA